MESQIKNAVINTARLEIHRGGAISATLFVTRGGRAIQQGFGGLCVFAEDGGDIGGEYIYRILKTVGVSSWDELAGKPIRIRMEGELIVAIGHFLEERWFELGFFDKRRQRAINNALGLAAASGMDTQKQ